VPRSAAGEGRPWVRNAGCCRRFDDDDAREFFGQGGAEGGDGGADGVVAQAEVDDEDLVVSVVDDRGEVAFEPDALDRGQNAAEDGELPGLAVGLGKAVGTAEALGVGDVVAEEVGASHGGGLVGMKWVAVVSVR
jgi:hypothetical protein